LPRVAAEIGETIGLTCRHVVARGDQLEHLGVHLDELVLRQSLLLLALDQSLCYFSLEEGRFDCVDDLEEAVVKSKVPTLKRNLRLITF